MLQRELKLLSESEKKYRSMFENATGGIFQVTSDGRFMSVNPALARLAGFESPEEMMNGTADLAQRAYIDPDRCLEYVRLLETEGRVTNFECRLHGKDGTTHWVSINSHAVRDEADKMLYFEGYLQEITERKMAEEQLFLQRDLALELAKVSSLDQALSLTIHAVSRAAGCECSGIYLTNRATGELELATCGGLSEKFQKKASRMSLGPDGWALTNGEKPVYFAPHDRTLRDRGLLIACFNAGAEGMDAIPASSRSTLDLIGAQLGNIIARLQAEQELERDLQKRKEIEQELETKSRGLEEMNGALKVLLDGRDKDKDDLGGKVLSNVEQLIQPYLTKLKTSRLDVSQQAWVDIIEINLREITSSFLKNVATFGFTPKELEVIQFMKEGRSSKEIAKLLQVCRGAVDMHRHRIRKKLGLNKKKTNLQAHLSSLV